MRSDCHIHMLLDGTDWRAAIDGHRESPDRALIRSCLQSYANAGFTYLRDGGDRWGVGAAAREMAPEFGITYRTPLAPLCMHGHYGSFIGLTYRDLNEYRELVAQTRKAGGDFIKIMISGLMDFDHHGRLTEEGLPAEQIRDLIRIAHDAGFSVMAHANGPRTVEAAAEAGVDSVEHGAYLDRDALQAMAENGTVWCPTISTVANLRGKGRFAETAVTQIFHSAVENLRMFANLGGLIAPGSDAGAWAVPHVQGSLDEFTHLRAALGEKAGEILDYGIRQIRLKF